MRSFLHSRSAALAGSVSLYGRLNVLRTKAAMIDLGQYLSRVKDQGLGLSMVKMGRFRGQSGLYPQAKSRVRRLRRGAGQFIGAFVFGVAGVALDPVPADIVAVQGLIQRLP